MTITLKQEANAIETKNRVYWLKNGVNSFGTHFRNDIKLPSGAGAAYAGIFFFRNDKVLMRTNELAAITGNGQALDNTVVFSSSKKINLTVGNLQLNFIKLEGRVGIEVTEAT